MISNKDRRLLEAFEEKYTPQELLTAIQEIKTKGSLAGSPAIVVDSNNTVGTSLPEAILLYIKKLEGYRIRLREIHWSAESKSRHELSDSLMSMLADYEDSIAEEAMGIFGVRVKVGDIVPAMPEGRDLKSILKSLTDDTLTLLASLEPSEGEPTIPSGGIPSVLEDIIHDLNKSKYLETLS